MAMKMVITQRREITVLRETSVLRTNAKMNVWRDTEKKKKDKFSLDKPLT